MTHPKPRHCRGIRPMLFFLATSSLKMAVSWWWYMSRTKIPLSLSQKYPKTSRIQKATKTSPELIFESSGHSWWCEDMVTDLQFFVFLITYWSCLLDMWLVVEGCDLNALVCRMSLACAPQHPSSTLLLWDRQHLPGPAKPVDLQISLRGHSSFCDSMLHMLSGAWWWVYT